MAKLSAIMCVYNEERLLPHVLKNIEPYVDEIVIVDGSPNGPSTDKTAEIAKKCNKVIYKSGTYGSDGVWDMGIQRNTGINAINSASNKYYMFLSADMIFMNMEILREAVDIGRSKIFFCSTIEFWINTKMIRLYAASNEPMTLPSPILEPLIVSSELHPRYEGSAMLSLEGAAVQQRAIIPQTIKFHLGWIRPFKQQVDKHIRHVRQHRWGDVGEKLLSGSQSELPQWAIRHVLSYIGIPSVDFYGKLPDDITPLMDMKYNDGMEEVTKQFEQDYGYSVFKKGRS